MKQFKILKNSLLACLCLAMILPLGSCKKKEEPTTTATPTTTTAATTTAATTTVKPTPAASNVGKLSGLPLDAAIGERPVLAVMIDNHPNARPQSGLSKADVIFEMLVEGSYTRYMALFNSKDAGRVGPIRSARDCFVDRVMEYDAFYTHFGGSASATQRLANGKFCDLNGMGAAASATHRDNSTGKEAPHNVFASTKDLYKMGDKLGYKVLYDKWQGFTFNPSATAPAGGSEAKSVTIKFNEFNETMFKLNDNKTYARYKDGSLDTDEEINEPLAVSNIIIQKAKSYISNAPLRTIELVGKGEGFLVTQGKYVPITWEKADLNTVTSYKTADGKDIILNPGQTWIEVCDPDSPVLFE